MRFLSLISLLLLGSTAAAAQTSATDKVLGLQLANMRKMQAQFQALTHVDGIADALHPVPFKKSLYIYSTPLDIPSEGGRNGAGAQFTSYAILSANTWDWNSESDTWTFPAAPQGGKVYARLTFSLNSTSHWSPCMVLRRQILQNGALIPAGKTISLPCSSTLGRRDTRPGSISVWVEWWNDNLPGAQYGQPSQTLEVAAQSFGAVGGPPGWKLGGLEIELFKTLPN